METSLINSLSQIIVSLILLTGPAAFSFGSIGSQDPNTTVAGTWKLTKTGDKDGRTVKFWAENGQLKGVYLSKDNQQKPLADAKFDRRMLYFRVPDFGLYFEMKFAGDSFEGKMIQYNTTEKVPPEPVQMSRMR